MEKQKKEELIKLLNLLFEDISYEKVINGITIYCSNLGKLISISNFLGGMGAYFNINYAEEKDFIDDEKYAITVIDYDDNWKTHEQQYI